MITFKQFLYEHLFPKQRDALKRAVAKAYPDHDNFMTSFARKATDHFFGEGNDSVRRELPDFDEDVSETHKKIQQHFVDNNIPHRISQEDYIKNNVGGQDRPDKTRSGGIKITKLIKDPALQREYSNVLSKRGSKEVDSPYYMVVHRGIEVGGQTNKGHSWENMSCKNVDNGIHRKVLPHEIANGTATITFHNKNTHEEIHRATLQPYLHGSGKVAYAVDAQHGIPHPRFKQEALKIAEELSGPHEEHESPYIKHPDVYNDNGIGSILHPKAKEDEIRKSAKSDIIGDRVAAMSMRHTPRDVIKQGLRDNSSHVRVAAVQHHSNTAEDLENHRKHETDPYVQAEIMRHRNASDDTIRAGLQHRNLFIKAHARNAATARGIDWKAEEQKNKPKQEVESFL